MTEAEVHDHLRHVMRGRVIARGDPGYDEARRLYNGMIDKRPRLIARCRDVADVIEALATARALKLRVAVRGGGHSGAGLASVDDGLVIDLSPMRGVRVSPTGRSVRVDGGATWGDVDHATHAFGGATPSGILSTTGVAGLTLGGGHGYLSRRYGLTIDNLLSADVVLADGRLVRAAADEHPDLFWALRGGGGNFGVVTSFELRLHPVRNVFAGLTLWSLDDAEPVMAWYDPFIAAAPRDLYGFFAVITVPPGPPFPPPLHGKKACAVVWCHLGPTDEAQRALAVTRDPAAPLFEHLGDMPYPALQSMFDPIYPPGLRWYWKADFMPALDAQTRAIHASFARRLPTPLSTMHLYPIDGAVHDVAPDATAFAYRDARYSQVMVGVSPDPDDDARMIGWTRDYWRALHPHSAGGAYVNFMMNDEGADRVAATYGANHSRLAAVKRAYDPENFFRVNHNIPPAAPSG